MALPISHDPHFWAAAETLRKSREQKLCLATSSADPCQNGIVAAHTIPRSQLQHIAENGHVNCFLGDLPTFQKTQGELKINTKGIGKFSVLNCFCAHHDRELFSAVENYPITSTPEQLTILHYRAIASEVYRKMTSLNGFEQAISQALKSGNIKNTAGRKQFAEDFIHGTKLGLVDIGQTFRACENALYGKNYGDVSGLVVTFRQPPTIMSVGGFSPQYDYEGSRVQDLLDESVVCDQISLSVLSAEGRATVVMAWLKPAKAAQRFAESFIRQRPELYTALVIQTAFEHLENTCMKISWWNSLREGERQSLIRRMNIAASPARRENNALTYAGVTFDDWNYDSHCFINA